MNGPVANVRRKSRVSVGVWLAIALAGAVVLAANAHLIYVAIVSQPACVTHLRQGEGNVERGLFSAAQSSCTPLTATDAGHS